MEEDCDSASLSLAFFLPALLQFEKKSLCIFFVAAEAVVTAGLDSGCSASVFASGTASFFIGGFFVNIDATIAAVEVVEVGVVVVVVEPVVVVAAAAGSMGFFFAAAAAATGAGEAFCRTTRARAVRCYIPTPELSTVSFLYLLVYAAIQDF